MKKLLYDDYGSSDVLYWSEVPIPEVEDNEVLISVKAAGLNPTDIKIRNGQMKLMSIFTGHFPRGMGLDYAGTIVAMGNNVTNFQLGDRVFGGTMSAGTFAEYFKADYEKITKIPHGISFAEACTISLNGGTAIAVVNKYINPTKEIKVLINGASGGIGLFLTQICLTKGAHTDATCSHRNLWEVAQLGSNAVFNYDDFDGKNYKEYYDVIVDCSGQLTFKNAQDLLKENGSFCTLTPDIHSIEDQLGNIFRSKKEHNVMAMPTAEDMAELIDLISSHRVKCIVGKTYPMQDAIDVQKALESGNLNVAGRIVFTSE